MRRTSMLVARPAEGIHYWAENSTTGEMIEASDLANIFRSIAKSGFDKWTTQWKLGVKQV